MGKGGGVVVGLYIPLIKFIIGRISELGGGRGVVVVVVVSSILIKFY